MSLARIKSYNPKKGQTTRTYSYRGTIYREEDGWYKVEEDDAAYFREATADGNPDSPLVFHVCATQEEAAALDRRERDAAERRAAPTRPNRIPGYEEPSFPAKASLGPGRGDLSATEMHPHPTQTGEPGEDLELDASPDASPLAGARKVEGLGTPDKPVAQAIPGAPTRTPSTPPAHHRRDDGAKK
jgi:hypothetical protein